MATKKTAKPAKAIGGKNLRGLKPGDLVEIRYSGGQRGRIVEFRGALGPNGANIYRIRVRRKPKAIYVELPEDQLKPVPVETGA
jgi:hypothetical protein